MMARGESMPPLSNPLLYSSAACPSHPLFSVSPHISPLIESAGIAASCLCMIILTDFFVDAAQKSRECVAEVSGIVSRDISGLCHVRFTGFTCAFMQL